MAKGDDPGNSPRFPSRDYDKVLLLRERIMRPIGTADDEWSIGYGKTIWAVRSGLPLSGDLFLSFSR